MAEPLLNLDTLVARDTVRIVSKTHPDGKSYELRNPDELGLIDHARIRHRYGQFVELHGKGDDITEAEAEIVAAAARDLVLSICPDIEAEVLDDLHDLKKTRILEAWLARHGLLDQKTDDGPPTTGAA